MNNLLKPLSRAIVTSFIVASLLVPSISYSQTLNTSSQDQVAAIAAQFDTIKGLFNILLGKLSGTLGAQVSGGSSLANDTFTDGNNVLLQNHTTDSGHTWVRHPSYSTNAVISGNVVKDQNGTSPVYYLNITPSTAEYDIQMDVTGTGYVGGPAGRISITADTYYFIDWAPSSWRLNRTVNGSNTVIGSYSGDSPSGSVRTVRLEVKNATKKVFINGVERISSTDNNITAVGKPGIVFSGVTSDTGDNFIVTESGTTTPPPSDTTAPTAPANPSATAVSSSQINLSWSASTDNVGVTGYNIYRGGSQIAAVANTSYNDTGLLSGTTYTYYIVATDAASNPSAQSTSALATTPSPSTPTPTVSLSTNPTSITSGNSATLSWSSTNATSCTASGAWSGAKTTSGTQTLTNLTTTGTYALSCTGSGGTTSASATVTVTSATPPPPPPSSTKFSLNDRVQTTAVLNVRATASASGTLLGSQATGNLGTVIGGPVSADGLNWWNVNYDTAPDGWSAEDYLVKYTTTPPPPSTDCSATSVRCVDDTAGATQEYSTIQLAVTAAVAGDTVLVYGGTYRGFVASKSGTATNRITIKTTGEIVTINQTNTNNEGITISNASYITIEGFTIAGMPSYGFATHGASATNPMRGIIIRNNTVQNSGFVNLYTSNTADSTIEGNITSGSATSHGIYVANGGSDNVIVRGNRAFNNAKNGIHFNGDVSVGGDGYHTGLLVENNVFYNNTSNGFDIDGVGDSTFQNNLAYGNGTNAFRAFQIDAGTGIRNLKIINNTFITPGSGVPIKITEDLGGHTIFNNILITGGSNGSLVTSNTNFKSANNAVNGTFSSNGGNTLASLASWQGSGYDANSFTTTSTALFTNAAGGDYTLKSGSTGIDKGVSIFNGASAPTTDIVGVSRQGVAYDAGAYEYASGTTPPSTPTPTVSLSASPTSVTSGNSSMLSWSSTNATSCTASGGWSGTKTTAPGSQSITGITTTSTYTLSCTGTGGTINASATITVTAAADTTAPTAPTNLTATTVSTSQINLSWSASTDPLVAGQTTTGISGYRIYRSGVQIATSPTASYSNTGLTSGTTYSYTVSAVDGATPANVSAQSAQVSATTQTIVTTDTTSPTTSLTAPGANTTVSGTITISATASDNIGVSGVQFKLDNVNLGAEDTTSPYSRNWNTTSATNGFHTILAVARDAAGNRATSTGATVIVSNITPDTTKPTVTITTPTTLTTYTAPTGTVTIGGTATDNIGVTQVSWSNSAGGTGTMTGTATWSTTITLQSGVNTITVTGRDAASNIATDVITITYTPIITDTQIPTTPASLTGTAVSTSQIDLSWTLSTDNIGVTGYKVFANGTQVATTTTTTYSHTNLSPFTTYVYTVSAYDAAGNTSALSSPLSVTTQAQATTPPPATGGGITTGSSGTTVTTGGTTTGGTTSSSGTTSGTTTASGGTTITANEITQPTNQQTNQPINQLLTGPFSIGMRSDQVKLLQEMLAQDGVFTGEATGYYGPLTQRAVETFQTKYNLVTGGSPSTTGYGLAGPGTRAKLNSLYAGGSTGGMTPSTDREALLASLRKQVAELTAILQTLIAKLAALKAAQGVQ